MSISHHNPSPAEDNSDVDRIETKSCPTHGKTSAVERTESTVVDRDNPVGKRVAYQTSQATQPQITEKSQSYTHAWQSAETTLKVACDDCDGSGLKTTGHPLDPAARVYDCDRCEGTGEVAADCACCQGEATEVFEELRLCASCASEQRADAIDARLVALDRLEALTNWLRAHVRPPPADLLYRAVAAVDVLRGRRDTL